MKYYIVLGMLAVAAAHPQRYRRGVIHEEIPQAEEKYDHALIGESEHHHQVQHEHAKSHQSIKFEHYHPVPVYVKKEHSHLLKHPLEKGHSEHDLKLIHPETEHKYGGGLVLEDHRFDTEHLAAGGGDGFEHGLEQGGHGFEQGGHGFDQGGHGFEQGGHGFEGSEGFHEFQGQGHYQFQGEHGQALSGGEEGHHYEGY